MSKEDIKAWADAGEEIFFGLFPEARDLIEEKNLYTTKSVSSATRDATVAGAGGETIGVAQIVGSAADPSRQSKHRWKGSILSAATRAEPASARSKPLCPALMWPMRWNRKGK